MEHNSEGWPLQTTLLSKVRAILVDKPLPTVLRFRRIGRWELAVENENGKEGMEGY